MIGPIVPAQSLAKQRARKYPIYKTQLQSNHQKA